MPSNFDAALWQNSWGGGHLGLVCTLASLFCLHPASWMFLIPGLCGEWAYFVPGTEPGESAEALHGSTGFNLQPVWFFEGPTWWLVPDLKEMAVFQHRKASTESWTWSDLKLESNLWFAKALCCTAGLLFFFLWQILVARRFFWAFWLVTLSQVWTVLSSPPFGKQHKAPQETAENTYLYIHDMLMCYSFGYSNMIMMLLSLPYVFHVTSPARSFLKAPQKKQRQTNT